jgi:hypothetical protein
MEGPFIAGADNTNDIIMKIATIVLGSGLALFSTMAVASTVHHRSAARTHRGPVGMVHLHPILGNPDGLPTLSGTGKIYAVPGWTNEETQYWIDNATGPKD